MGNYTKSGSLVVLSVTLLLIRAFAQSNKNEHFLRNPSGGKKMVSGKPNIILILTDDQDIELGSMDYMPETSAIFRKGGIEFSHGYVTTPLCCPSRSSILTGMYAHNHQVFTNRGNCSGQIWKKNFEQTKTIGYYLQTYGAYYTSYIGKYMNQYDGKHIPRGWNEWKALLYNSRYYNYKINDNGLKIHHGRAYGQDYYSDLITNQTVDFLQRMGKTPKRKRTPFLLAISYPSPHGPEEPAPQYSKMFMDIKSHHTPSYNFASNPDKERILQLTPKMSSTVINFTNLLMTRRVQTLQSVDFGVKRIFHTLKSEGLDENTFVFYTSDNGYHCGQFGVAKGKSFPYEFDIRVPFFLKPPSRKMVKIMKSNGIVISEPVLNIDLAPTFLDLAKVPIPDEMDGQSLVPLLKHYYSKQGRKSGFNWRKSFLIESTEKQPKSGPNVVSGLYDDLRQSAFESMFANEIDSTENIQNCGRGVGKTYCFRHDTKHWKTEPRWKFGAFCFCNNAPDHSYTCIRHIGSKDNYLFCRFIDGLRIYFEMRQDPYQLTNVIDQLSKEEENKIMSDLHQLEKCKGYQECWVD